jgi:adenylate cyclase
MRRRGDALRLTTELADARTGAVVWARSHDTSAALGFADQDRLVAQIVNTLAPRVRDLELRRIRGQRPEVLTVYERILLAREHLQALERDSFGEAKRLLDETVREEPEYAEAYALLADWQGVSMNQGWLPYDNGGRQEPERLARLALALDRDNIRALVLYGHRRALLHRDYQGARELFERALDVAPGAAHSWLWSSYTFAYDNEPQEAIRRVQQALDLSPRDRRAHDFYSAMCVAQYAARNYDEAAAWGRRALAESGVFVATMRWTAASLAASGRPAEALEVARMALAVAPTQRVANSVRNSPFGSQARREEYGGHLIAAGFNP